MIKSNLKQIMFTLLLTVVAVFTFVNISEAICIHTYEAATCTRPKTCTRCEATLGGVLGHNFEVKDNIVRCTRCGFSEVLEEEEECTPSEPIHIHAYEAASCIAPKTCTGCGATIGNALGHNYETKTTEPTCTEDGETVVTCKRCGISSSTELKASGHDYKTDTVLATCEKDGKTIKTCANCGDEKVTTIKATGHNYETKTIAATCIEGGKTTKTCTACGDKKVTTTGALGHKYEVTSTKATCTKPGEIVEKCNVCGDKKTTSNKPLGHEYKETGRTEATCTVDGKIMKACTRCTEKIEESITAPGHKSSIVFNADAHWYECDVCGVTTKAKEEHKFNKDNECTVCGYTLKDSDGENPGDDDYDPEYDNDELIIEPWMKENDKLDCLAVSLRSEPYEEDRANKNIYALDEKVVYYVDYKNGGKDTNKTVTLQLELPLSFRVVDSDGAKVSTSKNTLTWTFNGMENDESGTKVVIVSYKSLGKSSLTYKKITPKATISLGKVEKDISAVLNLIVKDFDTEINAEHEPYMYGDKGTKTFRPDATITRGEGALVLTRIFGISTAHDPNTYAFPDLDETYLEARKAVIAATAHGIIQGYPDGTYKPNKAMTRGEFMTILARQIEEELGEGFEVKDESSLIKVYKDKNRLYYISSTEYYDAHWSLVYTTLLARLNMTSVSESETNLRVDAPITRAEVAQLVNFYLLRAPAAVTSSTKTQFPDVSKRHELFADIVEATRPSHKFSITEDGTEEDE